MTSMADWFAGVATGLGARAGAGSSLSSSSSISVGSEDKTHTPHGKERLKARKKTPYARQSNKAALNITNKYLHWLTHLDLLLALGEGLHMGSLALVSWGGRAAVDFVLVHSQVQQQRADLGQELQAGGVTEHGHQVELQVLTDTAHLGLGQSRGQVSCRQRNVSEQINLHLQTNSY